MRRAALPLLFAAALAAAEAPSRYATLDGHRVHYKSYGQGREALVFIHGWTCDLTFWSGQAPVYEKRRSLLIDLPGHGASDKPELAYSLDLFARAVDAVLRKEGVERAVLIGHSMGTPVAVSFIRHYPDKAAGLVIVDGRVPAPPKDDAARQKLAESAKTMSQRFRAPDYKAAMIKMIDGMFHATTPEALREEIRAKMTATPQHVVASAMEELIAGSSRLAGTRYAGPVAALMAKSSWSQGYEDVLRTSFSGVRAYHEWDDAGHFLMMEQPERFNAALTEFLDRR